MGIRGRWQWTDEQVSISKLLQAIDMLLMVLSLAPSRLEVTPSVLPYIGMMWLMLQINADEEQHLRKVLTRIDASMPYEFDKADYKNLYRTLYISIFQFVIPGYTIFGDTSSLTWMRKGVNFQKEEDRVSRMLFQMSDYVPRINNKTLDEAKPACPLFTRAPKTLILKPSVYNRLFESYKDRQIWMSEKIA